MKLSIYPFIILLITTMPTSAFADKPEGEVKRYKVVLEKKTPTTKSTTDVEVQQDAEVIDQNANGKIDTEQKKADKDSKPAQKKGEEGNSKWWKLWGKNDDETKEASKGSETGQLKREENSRRWWKLWGEHDPDSEDISQKSEESSKKWWKPWN